LLTNIDIGWNSKLDILFSSEQFKQQCSNQRLLEKKYGSKMARIIRRRLDNLWAAEALEDLRHTPGHCREVGKKRSHHLTLDISNSSQLIFRPANTIPRHSDGSLNWNKVTAVEILRVEEMHA
jgi:plasmid maintenance system killer protein